MNTKSTFSAKVSHRQYGPRKSIRRDHGGAQIEKHKLFAKYQEGARKDVERVFGVLQSRFTIVRRPARLWKQKNVGRIMLACVILHNMIVEDERVEATIHIDLNENPEASFALPPEVNIGGNHMDLGCDVVNTVDATYSTTGGR